jgi:hypothetical protein
MGGLDHERDEGVTERRPTLEEGYLLLADISGYTAFVAGVHDAHVDEIASSGSVPDAYPSLGGLLDLTVRRLVPPFVLGKLEGDAVFAYASTDALEDGEQLLAVLERAGDDFLRHANEVRAHLDCDCHPCAGIADLRLKFLLHHGSYVVESIAGREELIGPDVTLVHRLAKNSVEERTGHSSYILVTEAAANRLPGLLTRSPVHEESYEHLPRVRGRLITLGERSARA